MSAHFMLRFLSAIAAYVCLPSAVPGADQTATRTLIETDSQYYRIYVTEDLDGGVRHISFGKPEEIQSSVRLGHPETLIYPYARTVIASLSFLPEEPSDMVCVGLGGGSLPMFFRHFHPDMAIDSVEIDPKVVELAERYLEFETDPNMRSIVQDARVFLRRESKTYDLIILDAYNTQTIPFHLTTREFLEVTEKRLKPQGIVVAHIWAEDLNPYLNHQVATYLSVFDHLTLLQAAQSGSYIFIARNGMDPGTPEDWTRRARAIDAAYDYPFELEPIVAGQRATVTDAMRGATVLTDDYAPVNLLRVRKKNPERPE